MPASVTFTADLDLNQGIAKAEKQLQDFGTKAQRILSNTKFDSRPLGTISSDISQLNKSLDASNARVLAFGASVAVFYSAQRAVQEFVKSTIEVEKSLTDINVILNASSKNLVDFGDNLFEIAKNTGSTFKQVAEAATELSRQGLGVEQTLKRTSDALILARLSGLDVKDSVDVLTGALNGFNSAALDSTEVINKIARVDANYAVSSRDLAEALKRAGSTAQDARVSFDDLLGAVTAVQQTTARGGAVIGNALKTIFTRLESKDTIEKLQLLGVAVNESQDGIEKLKAISDKVKVSSPIDSAEIKKLVSGTYQINILNALLNDLGKNYSLTAKAAHDSATATDEAIDRNEKLNNTLASLLNKTAQSGLQAANQIGKSAVSPALNNGLNVVNDIFETIASNSGSFGNVLGKGLLEGLGQYITGPGAGIVLFAIGGLITKFTAAAVEGIKTIANLNHFEQQRLVVVGNLNELIAREPDLRQKALAGSLSQLDVEQLILNNYKEQLAIKAAITKLSPSLVQTANAEGISLLSGSPTKKSIPLFANSAITQAIQSELASGVSASQIKIGSNGLLVNPDNPNGIGVYNTRDEPGGLSQGVNRALKEGIDPKKYGIPNFAQLPSSLNLSSERERNQFFDIFSDLKTGIAGGVINFNDAIKKISNGFDLTAKELSSFKKELEGSYNIYKKSLTPLKTATELIFSAPPVPSGPRQAFFESRRKINEFLSVGNFPSANTAIPNVVESTSPSFLQRVGNPANQNKYLLGGIGLSIAGGIAGNSINQDSQGGRVGASAVQGLFNVGSSVLTGASVAGSLSGNPFAAAIGGILAGTVTGFTELKNILLQINSHLPEITKNSEDSQERYNNINDSVGTLSRISETFAAAQRGEITLSSSKKSQLLTGLQESLSSYSPALQEKLREVVFKGETDKISDLAAGPLDSSKNETDSGSLNQLLETVKNKGFSSRSDINLGRLRDKLNNTGIFRNPKALLELQVASDTAISNKSDVSGLSEFFTGNNKGSFDILSQLAQKRPNDANLLLESLFNSNASKSSLTNLSQVNKASSLDVNKIIKENAIRQAARQNTALGNQNVFSSGLAFNESSFQKELDLLNIQNTGSSQEKIEQGSFNTISNLRGSQNLKIKEIENTTKQKLSSILENLNTKLIEGTGAKNIQELLLKSTLPDSTVGDFDKVLEDVTQGLQQGKFEGINPDTAGALFKHLNETLVKLKEETEKNVEQVTQEVAKTDQSISQERRKAQALIGNEFKFPTIDARNHSLSIQLGSTQSDETAANDPQNAFLRGEISKSQGRTSNILSSQSLDRFNDPEEIQNRLTAKLNSNRNNILNLDEANSQFSNPDLKTQAFKIFTKSSQNSLQDQRQSLEFEQSIEGTLLKIEQNRLSVDKQINDLQFQRSTKGLTEEINNTKRLNDEQTKTLEARKGLLFSSDYTSSLVGLKTSGILTNPNYSTNNAIGDAGKLFSSSLSYTSKDFKKDIVSSGPEFGNALKSGFQNAFKEFETGQKHASAALRDFALGFAQTIAGKISDIGISSLFSSIFGSGSGSIFGGGSSLLGGLFSGSSTKGFSSGGIVSGGSGVTDDVPAALSTGDYVLNRSAVNAIGIGKLQALNSGTDITLANSYNFNDPLRPTAGSFNVSSNLSALGQTDTNNPQNAIKFGKEQLLYSYLTEKANYDAQNADILKNFNTGKNQQIYSSIFSSVLGAAGAYAKSGSGTIGKSAGITDLQGASLPAGQYYAAMGGLMTSNGVSRYASGGGVNQTGDTVPALLTGGEFVVSKQIVNKYGRKYFDNLNNNFVRRASGGIIDSSNSGPSGGDDISKLILAIQSLQNSLKTTANPQNPNDQGQIVSNVTINIDQNGAVSSNTNNNTNSNDKKDTNNNSDAEKSQQLAQLMQNVAIATIVKQKQAGGLLYK